MILFLSVYIQLIHTVILQAFVLLSSVIFVSWLLPQIKTSATMDFCPNYSSKLNKFSSRGTLQFTIPSSWRLSTCSLAHYDILWESLLSKKHKQPCLDLTDCVTAFPPHSPLAAGHAHTKEQTYMPSSPSIIASQRIEKWPKPGETPAQRKHKYSHEHKWCWRLREFLLGTVFCEWMSHTQWRGASWRDWRKKALGRTISDYLAQTNNC